jgi:microcompartment protein CcmL/EutN
VCQHVHTGARSINTLLYRCIQNTYPFTHQQQQPRKSDIRLAFMSSEDRDAGARGGFKRQRERELADKRQEQRVEDVLAHTTHIVDAIAGINTNYVRTLSDDRLRLSHRVDELQRLRTSAQLKQSEMTTQLVHSNLKALRGTVGGSLKDRFIDQLRVQVDHGHSEVLDALAAHVDDALRGSLTVTDTQLSAERKLSATLVEQLRTYAQTLLETTKAANQRAFKAEVAAMGRDVLLAKLRATHEFAQNRLLRHEHEVDALMRVVAQLAERSRFAESARTEVQKAKKHVRWLEQYLDLNGIVAAAQPESAVAASSPPTASSTSPPDPALRHSAPHYFALKTLAHKDMTLTELVDSWQCQEARIQEAEQRYAQLEAVAQQVQHDALVVHQRYLEEKQRREIADRRITDMVRERLFPQKDASVVHEVQRLRWAYTEVVDDAAQLAVNLKVCRDELKDAQAEVLQLKSQIHQLKRDAETDRVALTIQELRREYAERVRTLEETSVRTQLQLTLAQEVSRKYCSVAEEATTALQGAAQANAELSEVPPPPPSLPVRGQDNTWEQDVLKVETQVERLLSLTATIKDFGVKHGELYEAQMVKLMDEWSRVRSEAIAGTERSTEDSLGDARGCFSSGSPTDSRTLVSSTAITEESVSKMDSVVKSSKLALREALTLLVASLQSTDVERASLLDASLSDAQYVTELMKEFNAITSERDRLRAQVKVCRDLLEKNHVTVVERALMHDVPVEDSLNVAEAEEKINVLRDQLAAAKQLCDRSLNEVKQVSAEKEEAERKLTELARAHEVLQGHAARLSEKLKTSLTKEGTLMEEAVSLQNQVAQLVQQQQQQQQTLTKVTEDGVEVASASDAASVSAMPHQLSHLFTALTATLLQLDEEVRALHSAREDVADDATDSTDAARRERAKDESDNGALLESLTRSGMMSVVTVLKETLQKAGLLKASLRGATGAQAAALCAAVAQAQGGDSFSSTASVIPQPPPETQRQAYEHALALLEAERQQMRERLRQTERAAGEMEATNQRLLAISKSILEKQNTLKAENDQLRAQVRQLTAPPPPAPVTTAESDTMTHLSGCSPSAPPASGSAAEKPPSSSLPASTAEVAVPAPAALEAQAQLPVSEVPASVPEPTSAVEADAGESTESRGPIAEPVATDDAKEKKARDAEADDGAEPHYEPREGDAHHPPEEVREDEVASAVPPS